MLEERGVAFNRVRLALEREISACDPLRKGTGRGWGDSPDREKRPSRWGAMTAGGLLGRYDPHHSQTSL
jgi:hypothetical protein